MAQKRSKRLQIVVDLAHAAESQAARNLSTAQNELAAEQQRLSDIQNYYNGYEQQFQQRAIQIRASDLSNARSFLSHLDQARQAQFAQIQHSEQKVNVARAQWRSSHLKSDALKSFQTKVAGDERLQEDKAEQKLIDEIVNQQRLR